MKALCKLILKWYTPKIYYRVVLRQLANQPSASVDLGIAPNFLLINSVCLDHEVDVIDEPYGGIHYAHKGDHYHQLVVTAEVDLD